MRWKKDNGRRRGIDDDDDMRQQQKLRLYWKVQRENSSYDKHNILMNCDVAPTHTCGARTAHTHIQLTRIRQLTPPTSSSHNSASRSRHRFRTCAFDVLRIFVRVSVVSLLVARVCTHTQAHIETSYGDHLALSYTHSLTPIRIKIQVRASYIYSLATLCFWLCWCVWCSTYPNPLLMCRFCYLTNAVVVRNGITCARAHYDYKRWLVRTANIARFYLLLFWFFVV